MKIISKLIVAADFKPTPEKSVEKQVLDLAEILKGTGVYIKVNSALRCIGYELINRIHEIGLPVFADLKLNDIPNTLKLDGDMLSIYRPEIVTVMCSSELSAMNALKFCLPETEVIGVTVLTHLNRNNVHQTYQRSCISDLVKYFTEIVVKSNIDGIVCSPSEIQKARVILGENKSINTPNVRLPSLEVIDDDQNPERVATPSDAIKDGANRVIVGRQVTQSKDPLTVVMKILDSLG